MWTASEWIRLEVVPGNRRYRCWNCLKGIAGGAFPLRRVCSTKASPGPNLCDGNQVRWTGHDRERRYLLDPVQHLPVVPRHQFVLRSPTPIQHTAGHAWAKWPPGGWL